MVYDRMSSFLSSLQELAYAEKSLNSAPVWDDKINNQYFQFCAPLSVDGTFPEGLQLRATALKVHFDRGVLFQLEIDPPGYKARQIARVEWRPIKGHRNRPIGPPELHFMEISGTHYHPFDLNFLEDENRMRSGNLPVARPIEPDFQSFKELIDFVGLEFRINNMELVQPPEWEADLFAI